jgi:hypothetical protein
MDGRILIERLNGAMLYQHKATPAEYKAGLDRDRTRLVGIAVPLYASHRAAKISLLKAGTD